MTELCSSVSLYLCVECNTSSLLLPAFQPEQLAPAVEIFLHDQADALGVEAVLDKVAVVGLVVHLQGQVAVGVEQVADVEVTDETGRCIGVVAIAELPVDEETVVEEVAAEQALVFRIIEAFITCRDVGSEVPIIALDDTAKKIVDLLADGAAEKTLHGQTGLRLTLWGHCVGILIVKAPDGQQVDDLLVKFLLTVNQTSHHLLGIVVDGRQFHVKFHGWSFWGSGDIHQTVHADIVRGEILAQIEIGECDTVHGIEGLEVEACMVGISTKGDGAALLELEVFLDDILNGQLVDAMVDNVVAKQVE